MRSNFRPAALALAVVALFAFAPAAMAKGGGDACASIDSFTMSAAYVDGQPSVTWGATTTNLCIDEFGGSTALDFSNSVTGYTGRAVYFGRGTRTFGSTFTSAPGVTYTIKVSVYTPSGKLVASQTKSVTAPPALVTAG